MYTIVALELFGFQLNRESLTYLCAKQLDHIDDNSIKIDFSGCIIDYPATSRIIDAAVERVKQSPSPRNLDLLFNTAFEERIFLKTFFFGSTKLPIESGGDTDVESLRSRLTTELNQLDLTIHIQIPDGTTPQGWVSYNYG